MPRVFSQFISCSPARVVFAWGNEVQTISRSLMVGTVPQADARGPNWLAGSSGIVQNRRSNPLETARCKNQMTDPTYRGVGIGSCLTSENGYRSTPANRIAVISMLLPSISHSRRFPVFATAQTPKNQVLSLASARFFEPFAPARASRYFPVKSSYVDPPTVFPTRVPISSA